MVFSPAEIEYLAGRRLARLATVTPDGQVQNNPVGFFVDAEGGTIVIGGHALGKSKKFRNVQKGSTVATTSPRSTRGWRGASRSGARRRR